MPSIQVYSNTSGVYEPPLILEPTAPGLINRDLRQLKAQKSWPFEVGNRGTWGPRCARDMSVYDIERWDEMRNVKVRPLPAAPFTIPRFDNIDRPGV